MVVSRTMVIVTLVAVAVLGVGYLGLIVGLLGGLRRKRQRDALNARIRG